MTKTRILIENACYHVYARGNQKQIVFIEKSDFEFYLGQLKHYKIKYSFHLYGYCLMPNHIHLLGKPVVPEKLSNFMQCLQRSYTVTVQLLEVADEPSFRLCHNAIFRHCEEP